MGFKSFVKGVLPAPLVGRVQRYRVNRRFAGLPPQEVFRKVYLDGAWGGAREGGGRFYSGTGSHDAAIVAPYAEAVGAWAARFAAPLDAVDLGCGDFSVGSRIRGFFAGYTACDIVPEVVAANRERFAGRDVDFAVLDIARDELPPGDVVLLRQVLQHLSNDLIARIVPRIAERYRYLILTEHLPPTDDFLPNRDKPTGPGIRLADGSGVVLTRPPFDLRPTSEEVLLEMPEFGGRIRTTAYALT